METVTISYENFKELSAKAALLDAVVRLAQEQDTFVRVSTICAVAGVASEKEENENEKQD